MIFDDILTCITSDASLNTFITGGIRHIHIDDNVLKTNNTKNWMVFDESLVSSEGDMNHKDCVQHYDLSIQILSPDDITVDTISDELLRYFEDYDDNKIRNISSIGGDKTAYDYDYELWYKTLSFDILYEN